jgi:ketosteroid isomerase-like protein
MGPPLNSRPMQGDAGVARDLIDAVNRRDLDDFLGLLQPDVEWDDREGWPGIQGVYSGPDGVRDWWARFMEVWDSVTVEIEDVTLGPGGSVLLQVSGAFRGEASGVPTEIRAWEVLWIRDGLVARRQLTWSREAGIAAARHR